MTRSPGRPATVARGAVLGFLLRCLVYWGAALALVSRFPQVERAGVSLTVVTLQLVLWMFRLPVQRFGSGLSVGGASVQIVADCSPHMPYLIYAAVVLAFPASWRQRLIGLVAGAVVVHALHTPRLPTLIAILAAERPWVQVAHR